MNHGLRFYRSHPAWRRWTNRSGDVAALCGLVRRALEQMWVRFGGRRGGGPSAEGATRGPPESSSALGIIMALWAVSGIEHSPIYVVATEEAVWSASADDYITDVPLSRLLDELHPGQHVYLVHLDSRGTDGRIKLTNLAEAH